MEQLGDAAMGAWRILLMILELFMEFVGKALIFAGAAIVFCIQAVVWLVVLGIIAFSYIAPLFFLQAGVVGFIAMVLCYLFVSPIGLAIAIGIGASLNDEGEKQKPIAPDQGSIKTNLPAWDQSKVDRGGVIFFLVAVVLLGSVALRAIYVSREADAKAQMELQAAQLAARESARLAREATEAKARVEREAKEANERALEKNRLAQLARWKFVGSTEFANIYANPTSRRRSGDVIEMWTIFDIKTPVELDVGWFASSLVMNEFDCRYGAHRTVSTMIYSGHMASGEAVASDKDIRAWTMPKSGTIEGDLWGIACNRQ